MATSSCVTNADTDESVNPHWTGSSRAQSQIHDVTTENLSVASGSLCPTEHGLLRGPSEDDGEEGSESNEGDSDRLLDKKRRPPINKSQRKNRPQSAFQMVVRSDCATPSANVNNQKRKRSDSSTPHRAQGSKYPIKMTMRNMDQNLRKTI